MRILVTGAYGFIGSHIASALHAAGHEVVAAVRRPDTHGRFGHWPAVVCDFARDTQVGNWLSRLSDVDAVVNCAGILRETRNQSFSAVHVETPKALFAACVQVGVKKVVQISALGHPADGEFIRSKHAADDFLSGLNLDWVILRPSVVYSPAGSYGGTSLLRALAALPFVLFLPGTGRQRLQPIAAEDLARAVTRLIDSDAGNCRLVEAVGPEPVTLADYLRAFRRWLGVSGSRTINIPLFLVRPLVWLGEFLGHGPLGMTMYRMLQRGNVASPGGAETCASLTGFRPRSLAETLSAAPSHVQDRWHARLYLLAPLLRVTMAIVWIGSGVAGLLYPLDESALLLAIAGVPAAAATPLVLAASGVDLALGLLVLTRYARFAAGFMLVSVIAYTLFLGIALPGLWLEPFGALIKNLPLIPSLLMMLVFLDRR